MDLIFAVAVVIAFVLLCEAAWDSMFW